MFSYSWKAYIVSARVYKYRCIYIYTNRYTHAELRAARSASCQSVCCGSAPA